MNGFRDYFSPLSSSTYLNTAAWGLLHEQVLEWRRQHDLDFFSGGSTFKFKALEILEQTRERVGACFHCETERIALVPNFSLGLNLLLEGLPEGSKVALLEGDYPSVNWPFEKREFKLLPISRKGEIEEQVRKVVSEKSPDILALSLVQWVDGLLVSQDFLRNLKADYPDLLIIADGTQYLGAFELNFKNSGIDVLGASGYKWMLGGNGNGFMLLKEGIETRIETRSAGFNSVAGDLSRKDAISLPRSLEPGHLDTLNFGSLFTALGLLQQLGLDQISDYNKTLSRTVRQALAERGLLDPQIAQRREHSTIFNIRGDRERYEQLESQGVVCSRRGGGIRLSFHCYNTENDLDRVLEILKHH